MTTVASPPDAHLKALALAGTLAQNAEPAAAVPLGKPAVIEPKLNGWRIIAHVHEGGVTLHSRSSLTYTDRLPHLCGELAARFPAGTWLDGEAIAMRIEGGKVIDDWGKVQSVMTTLGPNAAAAKQVTYMVFDLIAHGGHDARSLPFASRRELLNSIFDSDPFEFVRLVPQQQASQGAHEAFLKVGFEGSMVKALDARYASGQRGHGQTKIKYEATIDTIVMGFKASKAGTGLIGSVLFGQPINGELTVRGSCSGMNMKVRKDMTLHPEKYMGRVMEVEHNGFMEDGFRHPRFVRMRPDRTPGSVEYHNA